MSRDPLAKVPEPIAKVFRGINIFVALFFAPVVILVGMPIIAALHITIESLIFGFAGIEEGSNNAGFLAYIPVLISTGLFVGLIYFTYIWIRTGGLKNAPRNP